MILCCLSYKQSCRASMVVSNIGLAGIIRLSTPVLNAIYPAAIVLIALSFVPPGWITTGSTS